MNAVSPTDTLDRLIEHHAGSPRGEVITPDAPAPEYITIREAAELIGSKPWPISKLADDGKVRAVRYGRLLLVSADDVESLEAGQLRNVTPVDQESLDVLETSLRVINEARGTSHTIESVASACGFDGEYPEDLMQGEVDAIARYVGGELFA
jgi:excisionase family DNA binding protein